MGRPAHLPRPSGLAAPVAEACRLTSIRPHAKNCGVPARLKIATALAVLAVFSFALAASAPARPGQPTPLARKLARALVVPQIGRARSGAVAVDLPTGRVVFSHNAGRAFVPASNEKLAVTYAALVALGPAFRMHTDVLGHGTQVGATWQGNLLLKGYGDPTLSVWDLRRLAAGIRGAGIRAVTGRIVGDESFFDARRAAPGWKSSFYLNESPPLSALVVDRGVSRGALTRNPALAAASAFRAALRRAGVRVAQRATTARAPAKTVPLAADYSPPLWSVVRFMDRESDNFTAELLLKQLGALFGRSGSSASGAAVVMRLLAADGVPLAGVRIVDGSGLSSLDRLTPRALVAVLQAAWSSPGVRRALLAALPVAGKNGTLRSRMVRGPARGNVFAKTGTTQRASSLAGFVRGRYAFAILQNGNPVASWWARVAQDRFATVLAAAE
jgi:serine-type D-Ala-D-Ala carboxypeptidase/endopeptidase (penicillin-binding protein 4)